MAYYYKDSAMNAPQKYWGFSANKVTELYGENPVFRPYSKVTTTTDSLGVETTTTAAAVFGWDQKNMLAPLYLAIRDQQQMIEDQAGAITDLIKRIEALEN